MDIKTTVKENLIRLRRAHKLTQLELSQKINYSDKAISRWETGEVTPDIETLAHLADLYEIPITDFFLPPSDALSQKEARRIKKQRKQAEKARKRAEQEKAKQERRHADRTIKENAPTLMHRIALLIFSLCFFWTLVLLLFFLLLSMEATGAWRTFVWGVPTTFGALLVFFLPSPHKSLRIVFSSLLAWGLLVALYLQIAKWALFPLLFLGIPLQALILFYPHFRKKKP